MNRLRFLQVIRGKRVETNPRFVRLSASGWICGLAKQIEAHQKKISSGVSKAGRSLWLTEVEPIDVPAEIGCIADQVDCLRAIKICSLRFDDSANAWLSHDSFHVPDGQENCLLQQEIFRTPHLLASPGEAVLADSLVYGAGTSVHSIDALREDTGHLTYDECLFRSLVAAVANGIIPHACIEPMWVAIIAAPVQAQESSVDSRQSAQIGYRIDFVRKTHEITGNVVRPNPRPNTRLAEEAGCRLGALAAFRLMPEWLDPHQIATDGRVIGPDMLSWEKDSPPSVRPRRTPCKSAIVRLQRYLTLLMWPTTDELHVPFWHSFALSFISGLLASRGFLIYDPECTDLRASAVQLAEMLLGKCRLNKERLELTCFGDVSGFSDQPAAAESSVAFHVETANELVSELIASSDVRYLPLLGCYNLSDQCRDPEKAVNAIKSAGTDFRAVQEATTCQIRNLRYCNPNRPDGMAQPGDDIVDFIPNVEQLLPHTIGLAVAVLDDTNVVHEEWSSLERGWGSGLRLPDIGKNYVIEGLVIGSSWSMLELIPPLLVYSGGR